MQGRGFWPFVDFSMSGLLALASCDNEDEVPPSPSTENPALRHWQADHMPLSLLVVG